MAGRCRARRPSFPRIARLRGRRRTLPMEPARKSWISRFVQLRRFAWFFVIGLAAAAGLWAAALKFTARPAAPAPAHRFEASVGEDAERPHAVDYQRLDARLQ